MPTYSYMCTECGDRFDAVQGFSDNALTTCEHCSGRLRKLFGSVGVVFKGSGFYRTDSREAGKVSTNGTGKHGPSSDSGDKSGSGEKAASNGKPGSEKVAASASSGDKSTSSAGSTTPAPTSS